MKRIWVGTIFVVMFIFSGCAMPQATKTPETIDRLPDGEGLILDITQIGRQIGIYVVDADSGKIKEWNLQGPNLVKDGSKYCCGARTMSWSEADQQLFYAGWMACDHRFFQIHADGRVESMDLPSDVNGRF